MADQPNTDAHTPATPSTSTPDVVQRTDLGVSVAIQLNEIATSIGRLQEAVDNLKTISATHTSEIDGVKKTIYIATGVLIAIGFIGGLIAWLIGSGFDKLVKILPAGP